MKARAVEALYDALNFIRVPNWLTREARYDRSRYLENPLLRWSMERQFNNLGRALERAVDHDPWLPQEIPEIGEMIAFHTFLSKKYDKVDDRVVWATALDDMDDLRQAIQRRLLEDGEPPERPTSEI